MDYISQNKAAWEYNAYDFWIKEAGLPTVRAKKILADPIGALKRYAAYFDSFQNLRIANICGSCGKKAVPLAVLGADVTIFDISSDNERYASELAKAAGVTIDYQICDVLQIDTNRYQNSFDVVFMEGGILHYFHDLKAFMLVMNQLLKPGGKMICSDFHPFTKIMDALELEQPVMDYFSTDCFAAEMAHARFFTEDVRRNIPKCILRKYTISDILNTIISSGFLLQSFDEHPAWKKSNLPGEFTLTAIKNIKEPSV